MGRGVGMNVAALIPAKATSRRLPGKNSKLLGGLPLFMWSVRYSLSRPEVASTTVSTDSLYIKNMALAAGARVIDRPPQLCTDRATTEDVILHALGYMSPTPDFILLLQPTSPFRGADHILTARAIARDHGADSVISIEAWTETAAWAWPRRGGLLTWESGWCNSGMMVRPTGNLYLIRPQLITRGHPQRPGIPTLWGVNPHGLYQGYPFDIDINTEGDWQRAEGFLEATAWDPQQGAGT